VGELYYNSGNNTLYWWNGTTWVPGTGGTPSGAAGGDLTGNYPNPTLSTQGLNKSLQLLAGQLGLKLTMGTGTLTFPGGSAFTNTQVITNGITPTPTQAFWWAMPYSNPAGVGVAVQAATPGLTSCTFGGWANSSPANGQTINYYWFCVAG
jgi:hypothetical protein